MNAQDMFEQLRPNMERHTSFEVACDAVAAIEAEEAAAAAAGVQADESDSDEDGSRPGLGSDDEGGRQPQAATMEGDDASESGVSTADGTADEDEEVRVLNAGKHREEDIDPDFERELAALVTEHQGPGLALSAALPQAVEGTGTGNSGDDPGGTVAFKVMLRKGGKDDKTRCVQVPLSAAMAVQLRNKAASEESERAEIKRLVLRANQDLDLAGTPRASAGRPPAASKAGGYYSRGNAGAGRGGRDTGRAATAGSRGRSRRYSAQHSGGGNP